MGCQYAVKVMSVPCSCEMHSCRNCCVTHAILFDVWLQGYDDEKCMSHDEIVKTFVEWANKLTPRDVYELVG
jgi:hypothetical protein